MIGGTVEKRPSCIRAVRDVADFVSSLRRDEYLRRIVDKALDVLKENMFAGERIEKKKFPKYYVLKYGINNLYKYNLDGGNRLIYTLVADESGVAIVVLEVLSHKEYERRFGYD
jgi:mRNA-degrading endonuclease RelE of RelBE toxin-antitoxin system